MLLLLRGCTLATHSVEPCWPLPLPPPPPRLVLQHCCWLNARPRPPARPWPQIVQQRQVRHAGTAGQLGPAFRQFLDTFVPAFCRASRNLLDLQAAVDRLFPLYAQPLREGKALQAPALYNRIRQQVAVMVRELDFRGGGGGASDSDRPGLVVASGASGAAEGGAGAAGAWDLDLGGAGGGGIDEEAADRRVSARGLAFQLPYVCKFLMLASYVASRNKPSTDRVVFDPTHKKRVKRGGQANDRQVGGGTSGPRCHLVSSLL